MGDDQSRKAFLKGFEEGLKSAWREIAGLMTRGYSSTEPMVLAKSKTAPLCRRAEAIEARRMHEKAIPAPRGGAMTARQYLIRLGAHPRGEPQADSRLPLVY